MINVPRYSEKFAYKIRYAYIYMYMQFKTGL